MKAVVITGVSSGIGEAAARAFAEKSYRVFGSVRQTQDGERLRSQLGERFDPLLFDVTDHGAIREAVEKVRRALAREPLAGADHQHRFGQRKDRLSVPQRLCCLQACG